MPLRAVIEGSEIISCLCGDPEWKALQDDVRLKRKKIILPCCFSEGFLRVSKLGTKHFVHKRKVGCEWKTETFQHLKAKAEIVTACKNAGYEVSTEVSGLNWRADVLAQKGNIKVAFEVQWSPQTLQETLERQERYKREGIRGCWFFRKPPHELVDWDYSPDTGRLNARKDLPLFQLNYLENCSFSITLDGKNFSLIEFVELLLSRKFHFCDKAQTKQQKIYIIFHEIECRKCRKISHLYNVREIHTSVCGRVVPYTDDMGNEIRFWDFRPEILSIVRDFLATEKGGEIKLAIRYEHDENGKSLTHFRCYWCNRRWFDVDREPCYILERIFCNNLEVNTTPKWCYSENSIFCKKYSL
jgi:hypothetical protein